MKRVLSLASVMLVAIAAGVSFLDGRSVGQGSPGFLVANEERIVNIPGLGDLDLDRLPPEIRNNIRVPGVEYDEPPEQTGDLPPLPNADDFESNGPERDAQQSGQSDTDRGSVNDGRHTAGPGSSSIPCSRENALRDRNALNGNMPPDTFQKAWEHIQKMPAGETPLSPSLDVQSWFLRTETWLASLLKPPNADAQSVMWSLIGPAPYTFPDNVTKRAGFVEFIAVDPQNAQTIYLGTPAGGLWKTGDGGTTWSPKTDTQPTQTIAAVAVHPTDSTVLLVGTGTFDDWAIHFPAGTLRSTDGGVTWCQIGPIFGSSAPAVVELVIDDTKTSLRTWAATSSGLWYSQNAHDRNTGCGAVTWTRVTQLDRVPGVPDRVRHILVSPWNYPPAKGGADKNTLFASVNNATHANNGWYRSPNRGTCWAAASPPGYPSGTQVGRATIARTPNPPNVVGTDVIYSIIGPGAGTEGPATQCAWGQTYKDRLYKGTFADTGGACTVTGTPWQLVTATKQQCGNSTECCELDCQCLDWNTGYSVTSGCPVGHTCRCNPDPDCSGLRSVQIDPTTANTIALGAEQLFRSTDGSATAYKQFARGDIHDDHNALTFASAGVLLDGSDGGIWKTNNFNANPPVWSNLNGNLANNEFYAGTIDALNYGISVGGTQDDGHIKGGNPLSWSNLFEGDSVKMLIDPTNSNVGYFTDLSGCTLGRQTDGGLGFPDNILTSASSPSCRIPGCLTYGDTPVAMDPADHNTLVAYSISDQKLYRTTNATAIPATNVCWSSITTGTVPEVVREIAIPKSGGPQSNLIFAATDRGVWRTVNASTWTQSSMAVLPARSLMDVDVDGSLPCTSTSCKLYVVANGLDENPLVPSHVFQSVDGGQNWTNISGSGLTAVPNIPVYALAINPTNNNVLYIATDMGIYVLDHLPDALTLGTRRAIRDAYNCPDAALADRQLERLARSLEREHPGAAASLREGLAETLTVSRLRVSGALYRSLRSTNPIENLNGAVAQFAHNVRRWRDGEMIVRWVATAVSEAETKFRRLRGHKEMPLLIAALDAHADSLRLDTKKKVA